MIAAGDGVDACGEDFIGSFWRDARAARGVFAVGNDEINSVALAISRQKVPQRMAARLTDDIADKKQFHREHSTGGWDIGKT